MTESEPDLHFPPPSLRTVVLRATGAGLVTLAAVLLLLHLSHPGSDARLRWTLAQSSGLAALLWVAVEGASTFPIGPRGRLSVLGWMGVIVAAEAGFWLLGRIVVGT